MKGRLKDAPYSPLGVLTMPPPPGRAGSLQAQPGPPCYRTPGHFDECQRQGRSTRRLLGPLEADRPQGPALNWGLMSGIPSLDNQSICKENLAHGLCYRLPRAETLQMTLCT